LQIAEARVAALPERADAYVRRGEVLLRLGRIAPAIADFDRASVLGPHLEPYLWQRGIARYYAGDWPGCIRQFEIHRGVNPADVENAVWHFLCVARSEGVAAARQRLLPVRHDRRVPLMEIYSLFAGRAETRTVLEAATDDGSDAALFYAHLYLGLWSEVVGDADGARSHLSTAATLDFPHTMGDVARIHLSRLQP